MRRCIILGCSPARCIWRGCARSAAGSRAITATAKTSCTIISRSCYLTPRPPLLVREGEARRRKNSPQRVREEESRRRKNSPRRVRERLLRHSPRLLGEGQGERSSVRKSKPPKSNRRRRRFWRRGRNTPTHRLPTCMTKR